MSSQYFQQIMEDFFKELGIESYKQPELTYVLTAQDFGEIIIAEQPTQWVTLLAQIGEKPFDSSILWYQDILIENSLLDKATPKPSLGLIGKTLIQNAQLPLEYLTLQLLKQWIEFFLKIAVENQKRFIVNWKENV
ncbi:CesT family type III secretion system chaperone [Lawsonia intracellularis]|uniref:NA n=2 Tax=Lawsonia intracellularis TaxID=29546 RepID=Q1MQL0_LAWIP|nr:CesT family type III secretion system chaperone [Lawsonia intracellularis]AGC50084.1 hypothetical protein LAW_00687 [Lawsonia intracellularis N343]KAA0204781.1 hypothetical protein C4K43_03735 [Lawsonia intracellularis]MBZ3892522.1 CesT family type III secretion system chaperone [Lawsonia intracellularis]RBN33306.1 hypothetical protein DR194_02640 [Lawsonia intracellularis]CAJ54717.1 NA [Lawsonia intracellularis PHE/MN1-00]